MTAASPARTITYADTEPRAMRSQEAATGGPVVDDVAAVVVGVAVVGAGAVVVAGGAAVVLEALAPGSGAAGDGSLEHAAIPSTDTPTATLPRSVRNTRLVT